MCFLFLIRLEFSESSILTKGRVVHLMQILVFTGLIFHPEWCEIRVDYSFLAGKKVDPRDPYRESVRL